MSIAALFAYLIGDGDRLAWATIADLGLVVILGLVMAARWIGVYRACGAPDSSSTRVVLRVPPERHFPRPVVARHGVLAVATVVLVVFTVFLDGS
ncbi:MAG TPA: hypothetical protein VGD91_03555 [Trebonia sp.]